jgi:hypothetical protein
LAVVNVRVAPQPFAPMNDPLALAPAQAFRHNHQQEQHDHQRAGEPIRHGL